MGGVGVVTQPLKPLINTMTLAKRRENRKNRFTKPPFLLEKPITIAERRSISEDNAALGHIRSTFRFKTAFDTH
jgi:hypothetical protein